VKKFFGWEGLTAAVAWLGLGVLCVCQAASLPSNFYQVTQSADDFALLAPESLSAAVDEMVIRATGNPSLVNLPVFQQAKSTANRLLQSYYQDTRTVPTQLVYLFDAQAVARLLNEAGVATWAYPRPKVAIWWLIEGQNGTLFATQTPQANSYLELVEDLNQRYALGLVMPLQEVLESAGLQASQLVSGDVSSMLETNDSLGAQEAWVIKQDLYGNLTYWRYRAGQLVATKSINVTTDAQVREVLTELVSQVREQFQSSERLEVQYEVFVESLSGAKDYDALMNLFARYDWIKQARLIKASTEGLLFDLELTDNAKDWQQELVLSRRLVESGRAVEQTFPPVPILIWKAQ
jgi:hypothetical protein